MFFAERAVAFGLRKGAQNELFLRPASDSEKTPPGHPLREGRQGLRALSGKDNARRVPMFADARCSLDRVFLLVVIPLCGQIAPSLRHLQQARLITGIGGLGRKRNALLGVPEILLDRRHAPPASKISRL
jgi:hypothetical protein